MSEFHVDHDGECWLTTARCGLVSGHGMQERVLRRHPGVLQYRGLGGEQRLGRKIRRGGVRRHCRLCQRKCPPNRYVFMESARATPRACIFPQYILTMVGISVMAFTLPAPAAMHEGGLWSVVLSCPVRARLPHLMAVRGLQRARFSPSNTHPRMAIMARGKTWVVAKNRCVSCCRRGGRGGAACGPRRAHCVGEHPQLAL
jgi:hypothetical protein